MGNSWRQASYERMKGTNAVGAGSECPLCGEPFSRNQTYNSVSAILKPNQS